MLQTTTLSNEARLRKTLAVAGADGTVRFIEVESGKVIREVAAVKVGGDEIAPSVKKSERR